MVPVPFVSFRVWYPLSTVPVPVYGTWVPVPYRVKLLRALVYR
jgi:hypothetical protein